MPFRFFVNYSGSVPESAWTWAVSQPSKHVFVFASSDFQGRPAKIPPNIRSLLSIERYTHERNKSHKVLDSFLISVALTGKYDADEILVFLPDDVDTPVGVDIVGELEAFYEENQDLMMTCGKLKCRETAEITKGTYAFDYPNTPTESISLSEPITVRRSVFDIASSLFSAVENYWGHIPNRHTCAFLCASAAGRVIPFPTPLATVSGSYFSEHERIRNSIYLRRLYPIIDVLRKSFPSPYLVLEPQWRANQMICELSEGIRSIFLSFLCRVPSPSDLADFSKRYKGRTANMSLLTADRIINEVLNSQEFVQRSSS